jgi:uncharacterized membrane protein YdjX (TVP38/TMEM64 family)
VDRRAMRNEALEVELTVPRLLKDRRFWLAALALGVIFAIHASGLPGSLTLETLRTNRQEIVSFVSENYVLSALGYVALYVLVVTLSLPSAVLLTLSGGFLFGSVAGTVFTLIGATVGATLLFVFARTMMGDDAMSRFGKTGAKLGCAIKANAWCYLFALRLLPLFPFFLVNVIPAFAGVRLSTFVITTFFGIIPATVIFSLSGAGLGNVLDQGSSITIDSILTPEIMAALGGLALLALIAIPLRRKFQNDTREAAQSVEP